MDELQADSGSIVIETERDLRRNLRAINRRLNANQELARLVIVNPILVLEDLGVQLSQAAKDHIMESLRFPPTLRARRDRLQRELEADFAELGIAKQLPLSGKERADLLFKVLRLEPKPKGAKAPEEAHWRTTRVYRGQHPLAAKLAEYERVRQGALVFQPRALYEEYKAGRRKHRWIRNIRFPE